MPNWVSNLMVLRPEDAKALTPFLTEEDNGAGEMDARLDFEKIIPMPETVYSGDTGFGVEWHPKGMTLEEYRAKYPDGDWYKWSINNWGTKWNACHCSWTPPAEGEPYGILTFDTAWSLPLPIFNKLYEDNKVNFQLYFVEESHAFIGAVPFTEDETYPHYMDDPDGTKNPDAIFQMVKGEGEFDWMENDPFEILSFAITEIKRVLNTIKNIERPDADLDGTRRKFLQIKEDYIQEIIQRSNALVKYKDGDNASFADTVRNLRDYVYPDGEWYQWTEMWVTREGYFINQVAEIRLREQIQKLRMIAMNTSIGLTAKRCNERLEEIIRREQVQMLNPSYTIPDILTIDSVNGKQVGS